ncbi:MAG TPA: long-chain fatty acid--CoA ligase [Noviherbaspirillum sp.]|nr:long-chain fatty acid--CoA ligase [Noviherbaspirillum sp.]
MSLTQGLHRAVQQHPHATATVFGERRQTFAQYIDRVARLAGALRKQGVRPGDRVGILALNSDRYAESFYAIWWLGAVANPINTRWSVPEVIYSMNDCDTSVLIVDDTFVALSGQIRQKAKALHTVIHFGDKETPAKVLDYEALLAASEPVEDMRCDDSDLAVICYTGGTTGFPKGVMLTHLNLWASAVARMAEQTIPGNAVTLHVAPMFHVAGLGGLVTHGIVGGTNVFLPSFNPQAVLACIEQNRISHMMLVPTMVQMLLDHPSFKQFRLDSLKRIVYGASPIPEAVLDRALDMLPGVEFMQSYGMTEAAPVVAMNLPENHTAEGRKRGKLRAAGRASYSVEIRIVDENGREVPRNTVGEITVRGPNITQGYWNKPKETAAALRDGWFYTGDGAWMDEDGYIYVVDRMKDMIISGGENVYSAEVENAIGQHPAVAACAVVGIPSEEWGESVHAVIVLKPGMSATAEGIRDHCRTLIAGYKCPKSVQFQAELPLSAAGKVLKTVLREPFWQGRERAVN